MITFNAAKMVKSMTIIRTDHGHHLDRQDDTVYKVGSAHSLNLEYNTGDSKWPSPAVYIMPTKKEEK